MKTIVLDIETITDQDACARAGVDPTEEFPAWPLHQLMCVSLLTVVEGTRSSGIQFTIETFSRVNTSERGIVAQVERRLESAQEVLTFNGRAWDVPILLARAAVAGERVPSIARAHGRRHPGFHSDLIDEVTANGAAVRPKLLDLCAGLGIPAKLEAARGGVAELAAAGDYGRISRYCETDVVATWLAAQLWRSVDEPEQATERWTAVAGWVRSDQPRLAHLLPYCSVPVMPGGGRALHAESVASILL